MIKLTNKLFTVEDITSALQSLGVKTYTISITDDDTIIDNVDITEEVLTRKVVLTAVNRIAAYRERYVTESIRNNLRQVMNMSSRN